jgi:ribosomal 50S subunit-recycling heat shock protein
MRAGCPRSIMRLDLFLKNTGLIPRRSVAQEACDAGLVEINGKPAKASAKVSVGDEITSRIGMKVTVHRVLDIPARAVAKAMRTDYVELTSTERVEMEL